MLRLCSDFRPNHLQQTLTLLGDPRRRQGIGARPPRIRHQPQTAEQGLPATRQECLVFHRRNHTAGAEGLSLVQ